MNASCSRGFATPPSPRPALGLSGGGMTLTEIVLAIVLLALTFLPIMNVLGTTIKGNQKEEKLLKAIHLAQTKLNAAIQFPFNDIPANKGGLGTYGGATAWNYATNSNRLTLVLGPEDGFQTALSIANESISFSHQIYDPMLKTANPNTPSAWNWQNYTSPSYSGILHRYTLVVRWTDRVANDRFYSLITYKAKLVQ